ncbi:unnamed protein product [Symbiodinium sp. CCMP2592]|nr:unnamed protein product [Symbiodinium sp. CCMP2592]
MNELRVFVGLTADQSDRVLAGGQVAGTHRGRWGLRPDAVTAIQRCVESDLHSWQGGEWTLHGDPHAVRAHEITFTAIGYMTLLASWKIS